MLTYRFTKEELESGEFVRRPKVDVTLHGINQQMKFLALLDSGTDVSIIPKSVADFLQIDYKSSPEVISYGFGKEPFSCKEAKMDVTFNGKVQRQAERINNVPVLVVLEGTETEPVLGIEGIFEKLKICFVNGRAIQITRPTTTY